ncbi:CACTA en-spm transposon protein [Cucumis melo var. makuwa]|uniref:CACTA en-spm transposon protein n=1 Tax=Cucumis melo var. makuwa TaxID=1194695 RepID=A0A5D3E1C4_CUCMM|nr:CACTA en-spm transposon protein [Cucumis melo var. makuwa]
MPLLVDACHGVGKGIPDVVLVRRRECLSQLISPDAILDVVKNVKASRPMTKEVEVTSEPSNLPNQSTYMLKGKWGFLDAKKDVGTKNVVNKGIPDATHTASGAASGKRGKGEERNVEASTSVTRRSPFHRRCHPLSLSLAVPPPSATLGYVGYPAVMVASVVWRGYVGYPAVMVASVVWRAIMSSSYPRNNFMETNAMFLEFEDDLDHIAGGSSSVGDNTGSSSQQSLTPTPTLRRRLLSIRCSRPLKSSEPTITDIQKYELAERKGEPVDRVELFWETHVQAGTFVSQAVEDAHNQMLELQSQSTLEGSQPLSDDQATQKASVEDPSQRLAKRRVRTVRRHLVRSPHKKRLNYKLNLMKLWNGLKCKIKITKR